MKNKFKILIFIVMFIVASYYFFKLTKINTFKEDVLYSEKYIKEYSSSYSSDKNLKYLTREDAIKKALNVFKNGFNININRDKLQEFITLVDSSNNPKWTITWTDKESELKYHFAIAVNTEKVLIASLVENENDLPLEIQNNINEDEIFTYIQPLLKEINVNTDKNDYSIDIYNYNMVTLKSKSSKEFYQIFLNNITKRPIQFYRTFE